MTESVDYKAIDAVVNIWTEEALRQRPDWGDDFFVGKMNAQSGLMGPMSEDQLIETLDDAGIDKAFLIAAHSGRPVSLRRRVASQSTSASLITTPVSATRPISEKPESGVSPGERSLFL